MTRREFLRRFPNASADVIKANCEPDEMTLESRPWTTEEDGILRRAYESGDAALMRLLPSILCRSSAGISCRAGAIGVSYERGKYPRVAKPPKEVAPKRTREELSKLKSDAMKKRHAEYPHPMLGKPVPNSVRDKISAANKGRKVSNETILKMLQTRAKNGTTAPNHAGRSWKAGWRVIGGKRLYARSRWEANYARYLELLKTTGEITEWEHEPETFWFDNIKRGCRSYLPDFRVTFPTGAVEYHETKGWMDARSKTKIKRMAKYHPRVVLVVLDAEWFRANRLKLRGVIPDWEDSK